MIADNILANQKVLYIGHAVAAVAALNPHVAEAALNLIQVDYEVLPPVLDVREAMKPDAPLLHEHLTTRFRVERTGPGQDAGSGVTSPATFSFSAATWSRVPGGRCHREREFTTQTVHQGTSSRTRPPRSGRRMAM